MTRRLILPDVMTRSKALFVYSLLVRASVGTMPKSVALALGTVFGSDLQMLANSESSILVFSSLSLPDLAASADVHPISLIIEMRHWH